MVCKAQAISDSYTQDMHIDFIQLVCEARTISNSDAQDMHTDCVQTKGCGEEVLPEDRMVLTCPRRYT